MNKAEIKELKENYKAILKQRDDITKNATETIEKYQQENNKLKKEKENLQERIDKAIELIEKNSELTHIKTILHTVIYSRKMEDVTEVLETLKGEDK